MMKYLLEAISGKTELFWLVVQRTLPIILGKAWQPKWMNLWLIPGASGDWLHHGNSQEAENSSEKWSEAETFNTLAPLTYFF